LWPKLSKVTDYPAFLEACWQEHLVPRAADAPTVISTFAGAGGSSLGYSMAGFRELLAVEWDDNAVATFRLNFPDVPVYHGDIAKLSVDEVLQRTGFQPGELDVFDGSPPCQGFSTAGKRDFYDDRNQLFREYVRLLRGLRPKVLIMENVSGMVKGKMKLVFADILRELKASGYKVSARLLNAMYFNVPQSRERMIFVGVREDLGIEPSHPAAESVPVTVKGAFMNVLPTDTPHLSPGLQAIVKDIPQWGDGGDVTGGNYFGTKRLGWDRPSRTIIKEMTGTRTAMVHPSEPRAVTLNEASRIGGWPDNYKFVGDYKAGMLRIGNSVPPLFMRSIAMHVRREILDRIYILHNG
jgi:DNA (cytosine-5)-methyltransferase 1